MPFSPTSPAKCRLALFTIFTLLEPPTLFAQTWTPPVEPQQRYENVVREENAPPQIQGILSSATALLNRYDRLLDLGNRMDQLSENEKRELEVLNHEASESVLPTVRNAAAAYFVSVAIHRLGIRSNRSRPALLTTVTVGEQPNLPKKVYTFLSKSLRDTANSAIDQVQRELLRQFSSPTSNSGRYEEFGRPANAPSSPSMRNQNGSPPNSPIGVTQPRNVTRNGNFKKANMPEFDVQVWEYGTLSVRPTSEINVKERKAKFDLAEAKWTGTTLKTLRYTAAYEQLNQGDERYRIQLQREKNGITFTREDGRMGDRMAIDATLLNAHIIRSTRETNRSSEQRTSVERTFGSYSGSVFGQGGGAPLREPMVSGGESYPQEPYPQEPYEDDSYEYRNERYGEEEEQGQKKVGFSVSAEATEENRSNFYGGDSRSTSSRVNAACTVGSSFGVKAHCQNQKSDQGPQKNVGAEIAARRGATRMRVGGEISQTQALDWNEDTGDLESIDQKTKKLYGSILRTLGNAARVSLACSMDDAEGTMDVRSADLNLSCPIGKKSFGGPQVSVSCSVGENYNSGSTGVERTEISLICPVNKGELSTTLARDFFSQMTEWSTSYNRGPIFIQGSKTWMEGGEGRTNIQTGIRLR